MACCCKSGRSNKSSTSCLGRCDLPKHRCMYKDDVKPGPVPKNMGWDYTAQGAPTHQLRCGWRPGHIACPVLRVINQHYCSKGECCRNPCPSVTNPISCCGSLCVSPSCCKPCKPCKPSPCKPVCKPHPCKSVCCKPKPSCCPMPDPNLPLIRIVRHNGNYMISTKPSKESNAPSGPYPLKYVLNPSQNDGPSGTPKYCIEAKYNDICFDYTSSQASFVIDFTPPETPCYKTCVKKN